MNTPAEDPTVDDIAWMRRLAEEGAEAPMRGGSILMAAGLIYGLASLAHWAVLTSLIGGGPLVVNVIWLGGTVLFLAVLTGILFSRRRCAVTTASNRATGAVWMGVGWGIFAMMAAISALSWRMGAPGAQVALALIPSIVMVFYGLGWAVSAAMLRLKFLTWLAIGSLIAAPLLALLTGDPAQYLAYAAALFILMAWPGWVLMRRADRAG